MQTVTTIGFDIAKSVFQVHGVDAGGQVIIRRQLKRRHVLSFFEKLPPCLVGIEACASSHHWSRELQALGHTVRLMPPAYVKPYVKRQKNDAAVIVACSRADRCRPASGNSLSRAEFKLMAVNSCGKVFQAKAPSGRAAERGFHPPLIHALAGGPRARFSALVALPAKVCLSPNELCK
jgi:hypothetical protein